MKETCRSGTRAGSGDPRPTNEALGRGLETRAQQTRHSGGVWSRYRYRFRRGIGIRLVYTRTICQYRSPAPSAFVARARLLPAPLCERRWKNTVYSPVLLL